MADENKGPEVQGAETPKQAETAKKKEKSKSLRDVIQAFSDESVENKTKGKDPVKLSLTSKFALEFTKDYKGFRKGDTADVSELAKEFYVQNGYAKEIR